jgi:methionyl-tRNA formyltransferase
MNVVVLCTLSTGLHAIKFALDMGVVITKVIGLNDVQNRHNSAISGVVDIAEFCIANKLDFDYVSDYSLKTESIEILGADVDLLWVWGWQRLLPNSFIEVANIATIGAHGSCDGILKGRGRSPQNWALIIGAKIFQISIFKIASGIDDGDIIDTEEYELTAHDTINSSYIKSSYLVAKMISKVFFDPALIKASSKQKGTPTYFPKRTKEDGAIDWSMSTLDIYNQVKALEKPYPNAFSRYGETIISINRSAPIRISTNFQPGEVVSLIEDGTFLVACSDGLLQILEYYIKDNNIKLSPGMKFDNFDISESANVIYDRFKKEFPGKKLNKSLLEFWKKNKVIHNL